MTQWIRTIVVTALAWLGLAGLSDNIVEWQWWFEVGIMQHWRSVKEWVIAVLLDWVPFRVNPWMIDYVSIGSLTVGGMMRSLLPSLDKFDKGKEFTKRQKATSMPFVIAFFFIVWPINLVRALVGDDNPTNKDRAAAERGVEQACRKMLRFETTLSLRRSLFRGFVLFIPILFVCSNLLYEFG